MEQKQEANCVVDEQDIYISLALCFASSRGSMRGGSGRRAQSSGVYEKKIPLGLSGDSTESLRWGVS